MSITIHGNLGPVVYRKGNYAVGFIPRGSMYQSGRRTRASGDYAVKGRGLLTGRIVVGFNVGAKTVWRLQDLVKAVRTIREAQGRTAGATFLAQRGIYQTAVKGKLVQEPGAQIIIQNIWDLAPKAAFIKDMRGIAKKLTVMLKQESVLLEVQKGGRVIYSAVETKPKRLK